jgi:MFS family permease
LISIIGLWAGSVHVPTSVTQLAARAGYAPADRARLASYGTMILSAGTIIGCVILPFLAERFGRRLTMAFYFVVMFLSIAIGFGYVFYLTDHALASFFAVLFFLAQRRQLRDVHLAARTVFDGCRGSARLHLGEQVTSAGITFWWGRECSSSAGHAGP